MATPIRRAATTTASASDFADAFLALKPIFAKYTKGNVIMADEPGKFYLATQHLRPKDGYRFWLGGVEIKKNYVSAHVFPVYLFPDLLETISPELRKRMQGKACFNFKRPDAALFRELSALLAVGYQRMETSL